MTTSTLNKPSILQAVEEMYEEVASQPDNEFHFPTGQEACRFVGYPESKLDALPDAALESFAGVGYPFLADVIDPGDTVLDVGSGSGVDVLVSALEAGASGTVYGLDVTPAMIAKAKETIRETDLAVADILEGDAEDLPLDDESVDVVTSNGVFNLVPDKEAAFREVDRILTPGGHVQIADIVLAEPAPPESKADPGLWAECIVGAEPEEVYLDLVRSAGFEDVTILDRFDYFSRSPNESTREAAEGLGAHTLVFSGRKR